MGVPPGLQTDCEALLSRFQETDSVRFEDFTELWRSMKFGTIFWWVFLVRYPPLSLFRGGLGSCFLPFAHCGAWQRMRKAAVSDRCLGLSAPSPVPWGALCLGDFIGFGCILLRPPCEYLFLLGRPSTLTPHLYFVTLT